MKMHPVSSADRVQILADDPERPAGTGSFAGLIQNNGQLPALFAPRPAGWIGDEDLFVLDAAQHNKMSVQPETGRPHASAAAGMSA